MALSPGTRFGQYEIADEIGAGGMGVVYRATDTTLDREVAIKVLPESMAADAERITRFDREAKTLASLNHPNIATIYGLEKADGTTALVMELVEGPTLADRIEQGAIPADEALGIAMQIAEALEAAHGQNIVHRDLKPANIKLRPDGTVKVLDFGIAKALEQDALTSAPQSPMLTTPATQIGVILGTAAYMSPEQARGKPVDQRADIWAFGCVLYEMLTGQPAFGGEDVPITLARVLANDTDMESLPATISPAVRRTLMLCLQKDVRKRVADIRDVRLALEGAFETKSVPVEAAVTVGRPAWRQALPIAAAAIVAAVITAAAVWVATQPEPPSVTRFVYALPEGQAVRNSSQSVIALSPDGRHFVYNTDTPQDGLYLRTMSQLEARLIPGTGPRPVSPTFSPDGQSLAYYDADSFQLERIAITGSAPIFLTDVRDPVGLSWEADGTFLFGQRDGIYRVSANGGTTELLIPTTGSEIIYGPRLLPDWDLVLFSVRTQASWDSAQIVAQSLSTGERTVLVRGGSDGRYISTGHIVYASGSGLFAIAFDPDSLTISGAEVPLVQGVLRASSGAANYGVSEDGTLVYVSGETSATPERSLVWVDREGREEPLGAPLRTYQYPRISPDGTKVALDVRDQERDIWIWDLARERFTRLTFDSREDEFPVWSPDSQRIVFSSNRDSGSVTDTNLFWRAADGTGSVERLAESEGQIFPVSYLPDMTGILVRRNFWDAANDDDIAVFRLEGEDRETPLLTSSFEELNPEVSPDGKWLAYTSNESGNFEIFVRPFPDLDGGRWQVSTDGGVQPLWARNGQELFYRNGDAVMTVSIKMDPSFTYSNPEVVFEDRYFREGSGRSYDVSPTDGRFLMITEVGTGAVRSKIIVVENWFEELNRLAPPAE